MNSNFSIERTIFDFDNTLFDTEKKKHRLYDMAKLHGYTHKRARNIYKKARTESKKIIMSLSSYLKVLKDELANEDKEFLSEQVSEIIHEMEKGNGLLPFAGELLKYCKNIDLDSYVLSLGVRDWQEEKVEQSGIKKYISEDRIYYTDSLDNGKTGVLKSIFGNEFTGESTSIFNDKPDETEKILKKFPECIAFVRHEERDDRYDPEDFKNLQEKYPDRVYYSKQLKDLMNEFKKIYENK